MENNKIEIRCKSHNCNRLFMNYFITGENVELNLQGFELKCEKCKRVLRMKKYSESFLVQQARGGIFKI